jgi:hypothetical protein
MTYETAIDYVKNKVDSIYKVVDVFEITLGEQTIKVKILNGFNGIFYYRNSHWYHGPEQAGPYISSINGFDTEGEALHAAVRELTFFYKPEHEGENWIVNQRF